MPSCAGWGNQVGLRRHQLGINKTASPVELLRPKPSNSQHSHIKVNAINDDTTTTPTLEVRQSADRGYGLFTLNRIPAYTKIIDDDALLSLATGEDIPQLWQKYSALPKEFQENFNDLSCTNATAEKEEMLVSKLKDRGYAENVARNMAQVGLKFQANAFKTSGKIDMDGTQHNQWASALFPTIARINHSCIPNSHTHYNPASGAQVLYTLTDIQAGAELEISYFDMTMPFADRQDRALSWGFKCSCQACGMNRLSWNQSYDDDLALIHSAITTDTTQELDAFVRKCRAAIYLASSVKYRWLVAALPRLYHNLAMALLKRRPSDPKDLEEAIGYQQEALHWESRITGPGSPSSQERRIDMAEMRSNLGKNT